MHKIDFNNLGSKKIRDHHKNDKKSKNFLKYILQPLINCKGGFKVGKYEGPMDLRLILLNHKIIQAYIRIAKKGNFKCNYHQGGKLFYISPQKIPKDVLTLVKKIIKKLDLKLNLKHSLYTLDFIRSNKGNLYFIEGNTNPGIDWKPGEKRDEVKSKEIINLIVKELKLILRKRTL